MIYQKYSQKLEKEVVALLNVCFDGKAISSESFRWKHFDTFFNQKPVAMVAIDGKKVCAFVCFNPVQICCNQRCFFYFSCSVQATLPQYRRRGIITDLTKIIEKKIGNTVNFLGFSNLSGVQVDLHSKRINYKVLGQLKTILILSLPYKTGLTIKQVEKISNVDCSLNYLHFIKNIGYIDWRYYNNPKNKYVYYDIYNSASKVGQVIAKKHLFKYEVLDIYSFDIHNYQNCVKAFANYSFKKHCFFSTYTYLPNRFWSNIFPFASVGKKIEMFFTIKSKSSEVLNVENWIIQGGDIQ